MAKLICASDKLPRWECVKCEGSFAYSDLQCDHINPINNTIPQTLDEYKECFHKLDSKELQILCKPCHKLKTSVDAYNKKYTYAINLISDYLEVEKDFIIKSLTDWATIKKFSSLIEKIHDEAKKSDLVVREKKIKSCLKKLDKLKEIYL